MSTSVHQEFEITVWKFNQKEAFETYEFECQFSQLCHIKSKKRNSNLKLTLANTLHNGELINNIFSIKTLNTRNILTRPTAPGGPKNVSWGLNCRFLSTLELKTPYSTKRLWTPINPTYLLFLPTVSQIFK